MVVDPRRLEIFRVERPRLPRPHIFLWSEATDTLLAATLGRDGDLATASTINMDPSQFQRHSISVAEVRELPDAARDTLEVASSLGSLLQRDARSVRVSSRSSAQPLPREDDADGALALELSLCERDIDCTGGASGHVWLCRGPVDGDPVWCLWHLNRQTGNLVPPKPVTIES